MQMMLSLKSSCPRLSFECGWLLRATSGADGWLLVSWVLFVAIWVLSQVASSNGHVASCLVATFCVAWVVFPIIRLRGFPGFLQDVRSQCRELRSNYTELFFLLQLPVLFAVAHLALEKPEPALVAVSFLYVATHLPSQLSSSVSRVTLQRMSLTVCLGTLCAAIMCFFADFWLELWSIALFFPNSIETSCMHRQHQLTGQLSEMSGDVKLTTARKFLSYLVTYFGNMGEVPPVYRSMLFVYIFAQLAVACPRSRRRLQVPFVAVIYAGFVSASLKILVHRERPMWDANPRVFTGPSFSWRNTAEFSKIDMSTPSGHVAVTVAVARCLYRLWLRDYCAGCGDSLPAPADKKPGMAGANWLRCLPFYLFGVIAGICRTAKCSHWASDCVVGALVGVLVAGRIVPSPEPSRASAWGMLGGIFRRI